MTQDGAHLKFLEGFNEDLMRLGCGVRVAAVSDSLDAMEIVDLDGAAIGRVPTRIEPDVFAAFMLIVEQSFAEGRQAGGERSRPTTH